ncbi:MAG: DUF3291 domain-containing protein [Pseudomonadota bacterium]
MNLAEFNIGTLKYNWDDPRVADFVKGLERVNGIARRSPGFVWMMHGDAMEATHQDSTGPLGGNARIASTLSVWEDATALEHFVWNTLHKQFYDRKTEWFGPHQGPRLVMWWVPADHRPGIAEAVERLRCLERDGDSDYAFGWSYLKEAAQQRQKQRGNAA